MQSEHDITFSDDGGDDQGKAIIAMYPPYHTGTNSITYWCLCSAYTPPLPILSSNSATMHISGGENWLEVVCWEQPSALEVNQVK